MPKHTPGPWKAFAPVQDLLGVESDIISMASKTPHGENHCVASLSKYLDMSDAERQANADLIAAAPELLQAAKVALAWIAAKAAGENPIGVIETLAQLDAVIRKAENRDTQDGDVGPLMT